MKKWNPSTIQSPLARARGLGSAKEGVEHWWAQRVTAVALIPLVIWFVYSIVTLQNANYETFTIWLAHPFHALAMILFIIAATYHGVLGAQVIVEDYIHKEWFKIAKLMAIKLFFVTLAIASIFSLLKIAFAS